MSKPRVIRGTWKKERERNRDGRWPKRRKRQGMRRKYIKKHKPYLIRSDGTLIDPFYRCLNCGVLISKGTLEGLIKDGEKCLKCNKVGWVEHEAS